MNLRLLFSGLLLAAATLLTAQDVTITFNVGTEFIDVDPGGLYIAGGAEFTAPGDPQFQLTDPDGDGVYSLTITRPSGFSSFYTIANGACPDYGCKEQIAGQPCSDPDNFNDRFLAPVTENTVINTCFGECSETTTCSPPPSGVNVTFALDMTTYTEPFTTAFVSGGFNGWNGNANPMSDDDGDGIWTATVEVPLGPNEYKFQLDEWMVQDMFTGDESCTTDPGEFVNRIFTAMGTEMTLDPVCLNSCTACDGMVANSDVTFTVDMSDYTETFTEMRIAGPFNGWTAANNPMTDNGDGTYSTTISLPTNEQAEFKFVAVNVDVETFEDVDDLAGQSCVASFGDNGEFVNRVITPTMEAESAPTFCYESCDACGFVAADSEVTFTVDMSDYTETFTEVRLAGPFNGWTASSNPMTDNGDGTYSATVTLPTNEQAEFKFVAVNGDMENFEDVDDLAGQSCVASFGDNGEFVNRVFTPTMDTESAPTFCYESCDACSVNTIDLAAYGINFDLYPTIVDQQLNFTLGQQAAQQSTIQIVTAEGKLVQTMSLQGEQRQQLDVSQLAAGFYFIRLQHRDAVGVRRFVKQ